MKLTDVVMLTIGEEVPAIEGTDMIREIGITGLAVVIDGFTSTLQDAITKKEGAIAMNATLNVASMTKLTVAEAAIVTGVVTPTPTRALPATRRGGAESVGMKDLAALRERT